MPAQRPQVRTDKDRAAVRRTLERAWALFDSELVTPALAALKRAKTLPAEQQERLVARAKVRLTTSAPLGSDKLSFARWLVDHALVRGLALPGLGKRDVFVAMFEGIAHDEEIAAVMDRSRDWRAADGEDRRRDQRKLMTQRSRLNKKRRELGY